MATMIWDEEMIEERKAPAHQAFRLLHIGFTLLPIVAGLDKFFNLLVPWEAYLSPAVAKLAPFSISTQMRIGGLIEIAAGLLVAFNPRVGGYVVAAWLWAIILNLLSMPGYYDIALRDAGLSLGALALARLASLFASSHPRPFDKESTMWTEHEHVLHTVP